MFFLSVVYTFTVLLVFLFYIQSKRKWRGIKECQIDECRMVAMIKPAEENDLEQIEETPVELVRTDSTSSSDGDSVKIFCSSSVTDLLTLNGSRRESVVDKFTLSKVRTITL